MMRRCGGAVVLLALFALAGCGERDQSLSTSASKADGQPWEGAKNNFVAPGYQPGDKTRWQTQLRQRTQNQNEYVKTN